MQCCSSWVISWARGSFSQRSNLRKIRMGFQFGLLAIFVHFHRVPRNFSISIVLPISNTSRLPSPGWERSAGTDPNDGVLPAVALHESYGHYSATVKDAFLRRGEK